MSMVGTQEPWFIAGRYINNRAVLEAIGKDLLKLCIGSPCALAIPLLGTHAGEVSAFCKGCSTGMFTAATPALGSVGRNLSVH